MRRWPSLPPKTPSGTMNKRAPYCIRTSGCRPSFRPRRSTTSTSTWGGRIAFHNAWRQAQEVYEELLAYVQQKPLPTLVSMTLNRLAILAAQQSFDRPQVRALLEQAGQMAQTSHEQRTLAETEWNLAQLTAEVWEDPTSAFPHSEQALPLARASNDTELQARSLCSLGSIHLLARDVQQAMHCDDASMALYTALDH